MKKTKHIHNLDTLDKEIYRLQLETMKMEQRLGRSFEYLQENCASLLMNVIFRRRKKSESSGFFSSFFHNDNFKSAFNRITDRLAGKAAEGIEVLLEKLFRKKE